MTSDELKNIFPLTSQEITARAKMAGVMLPIVTMQANFAEKQPPVPTGLKPLKTSEGTLFIRP